MKIEKTTKAFEQITITIQSEAEKDFFFAIGNRALVEIWDVVKTAGRGKITEEECEEIKNQLYKKLQ